MTIKLTDEILKKIMEYSPQVITEEEAKKKFGLDVDHNSADLEGSIIYCSRNGGDSYPCSLRTWKGNLCLLHPNYNSNRGPWIVQLNFEVIAKKKISSRGKNSASC